MLDMFTAEGHEQDILLLYFRHVCKEYMTQYLDMFDPQYFRLFVKLFLEVHVRMQKQSLVCLLLSDISEKFKSCGSCTCDLIIFPGSVYLKLI